MAAGNKTHVGNSGNFLERKLSQSTSILGLKIYVLIAICVACLASFALLIALAVCSKRRSKRRSPVLITVASKQVVEINPAANRPARDEKASADVILPDGKSCETKVFEYRSTPESNASAGSQSSSSAVSTEFSQFGWGRWYGWRELEMATNGFAAENVIGEGGYGIVYRGVLSDTSVIAVKNLFNNRGQAEKEFKVEVEAIGKVRHKNLVGLVGYCVEGAQRMLVYEYIDNGNLEQWLHGDVGPISPLTWDIRMKIAIGTAKGLAYLHEGLEPKVVHRDIKSSNILLDKQWNPRVSDFGLAKLLGSESTYVTTRVMGTFGYVAPEYASTGMLNEGSDVYSFGILLMEIISGRSPVDYGRPSGQVNLVEWFKGLVGSRRGEEVVDPLIEVQPPSRALKRMLLVCLRCIDLDAHKRPKMGQVVHMLEADEFPFRSEIKSTRGDLNSPRAVVPTSSGVALPPKNAVPGSFDKSGWR